MSELFQTARRDELFFEMIRRARAAEALSDHDTYKVGVALSTHYNEKDVYEIRTGANRIPQTLKDHGYTRLGSGSATSHGEFWMYKDGPANGIATTVHMCPTCANKSIIFGIGYILIDHKAYTEEKLRERFQSEFDSLTIPLLRAAQVPVYAVNLEKKQVKQIVSGPDDPEHRPRPARMLAARIASKDDLNLISIIQTKSLHKRKKHPVAALMARHNISGERHILAGKTSDCVGFNLPKQRKLLKAFEGHRYVPRIDATLRVLMEGARRNINLQDSHIAINYLPPSGRFVDMLTAGIGKLSIAQTAIDEAIMKDSGEHKVIKELEKLNAVEIEFF